MKIGLLVVVLLAVALIGCAKAQSPLGSWQSGRSTFYQGIDGGNCGFGGIASTQFPFRHIAGTFHRASFLSSWFYY